MADYNKYNDRVDSLVTERATLWPTEGDSLDEHTMQTVDRRAIEKLLHQQPSCAGSIAYHRTPTGFIREITVTPADLHRLGIAQ